MDGPKSSKLRGEALEQFQEGLSLVFSSWWMLQEAVIQQWGGPYSSEKAASLESSVLGFFCQSKKGNEPLYISDLEDLLCDGLNSLSLGEEEVEEVAEKLMNMHEECLEGNYQSIQKLRGLRPVPHVVQAVVSDDDDCDDSDLGNEVGQTMMKDSPGTFSNSEAAPQDMEVDGWVTVSRKKSKGRKK